MAAPTFVSKADSLLTTFLTTVTMPSGITDGDFLLTVVLVDFSDADITPPAGWTEIAGLLYDPESQFQAEVRAYQRIASSEPGSYTWTISGQGGGNNNAAVSVLCYTGNHATPLDDDNMVIDAVSDTSAEAPSVTTTEANTTLICIWAGGFASATVPGGMSERTDYKDAGMNNCLVIGDEAIAAAGATGTRTATLSGSAQTYGGSLNIKSGSAPTTTLRRLTPISSPLRW